MLLYLFKKKMIIFFFTTLLINAFFYTPSFATEKLPKALQKVLGHKKSIIIVRQSAKPIIKVSDLPKSFETDGQNLLKTPEGLFLVPEGTGRIYKWSGTAESGEWVRIDSTFFTGYNYGALVFNLGDEILSFGGQGFWNTNGNLRYYNKKSKEWNVVYLNQSYPWFRRNPFMQSVFQIDTSTKKLFVMSSGAQHDQAIKNTSNLRSDGTIMMLDIESGNWQKVGKADTTDYFVLAQTPWGMYVNNHTIVDLKTNKKYLFSEDLKKNWETHVIRSTGNHELDIVFAIDSTIYFGDYGERLDSITISQKDLILCQDSFFTPEEQGNSGKRFMWIAAIAMMIVSPFMAHFVIRKKGSNRSVSNPVTISQQIPIDIKPVETPVYRSTIQANMLDDQEILLMRYILEQSGKSELTSIDQINQLLGLNNRSGEVQKRTRSILISGINEKLQIIVGSMEPIIEKKRSEFDKRSYEYFILPKYFSFVKEILNNLNKDAN